MANFYQHQENFTFLLFNMEKVLMQDASNIEMIASNK